MLTLYDYLPSQNGWKVRQLLQHLQRPYQHRLLDLFGGEGQTPEFLALNPTGKVPTLQLEDGQSLAESNAILVFLAEGSDYLPQEPFARAKVLQWLSFEQEHVESVIGSLRYWCLTGKLAGRSAELVAMKRVAGQRSLALLDHQLSQRPFVAGESYSIADISIYAYAALAEDAGYTLTDFPHFTHWLTRVQTQPGHLALRHDYSADPKAFAELP